MVTEASDYALRDLAAHLARGGLTSRLYDLARNPSFSRRQAERFPGEPKIALSAQRTALATAAAHDDPVAIAEFAVRHVTGLTALSTQSPLAPARAGALDRAWQLADRPHADDRSLWHLLLAWDLTARGETDACERTLSRLLRTEPTSIEPGPYLDQQNWRNSVAQAFLGTLADHPTTTPRELAQRLLPRPQIGHPLTRHPEAEPQWSGDKEKASVDEGLRLAASHDITGARRALNRIPLDGYGYRTRAYLHVIEVLLCREHESAAIALAAEMLSPTDEHQVLVLHCAKTLATLATRLAASHPQAALDLLAEATAVVAKFDDVAHRFQGCQVLADAELAISGTCDIPALVARVVGSGQAAAIATITISHCAELTKCGQLDTALAMADDIPEPFWWMSYKHDAYAAISRALSETGHLDRAREIADLITVPTWESSVEGTALAARADAFAGLTVAAAEAMDTSRARGAFEEIDSRGSGTDGDLGRWNAAYQEAATALLLHLLKVGGSGIRELGRSVDAGVDTSHFEAASQAVANGKVSDAAEALAQVIDPGLRGLALCQLATLAKDRAEGSRLCALALGNARQTRSFARWRQLLGAIAEQAKALDDSRLMSQVLGALNLSAADFAGDQTGGIMSALKLALQHGDPSKVAGLIISAANWPGAAYGLCGLLVGRSADATEPVLKLVQDITQVAGWLG